MDLTQTIKELYQHGGEMGSTTHQRNARNNGEKEQIVNFMEAIAELNTCGGEVESEPDQLGKRWRMGLCPKDQVIVYSINRKLSHYLKPADMILEWRRPKIESQPQLPIRKTAECFNPKKQHGLCSLGQAVNGVMRGDLVWRPISRKGEERIRRLRLVKNRAVHYLEIDEFRMETRGGIRCVSCKHTGLAPTTHDAINSWFNSGKCPPKVEAFMEKYGLPSIQKGNVITNGGYLKCATQ